MALAAALALAPGALAATAYEHVGEFGGEGSDPGLFATNPHPQRIAVHDATGNILVADTGNDRVQVFEPDGSSAVVNEDLKFGDSTLTDDPIGVAVDQDTDDVYVIAAGSEAIVKFNPVGDPSDPTAYTVDTSFESPPPVGFPPSDGEIGSFGTPGATPSAGGIAVDPTTGDLLVADAGLNLIQRYESGGWNGGAGFRGSFDGATFPVRPAFAGVRDLAVNSTGEMTVADVDGTEARVDRFDSDGNLLGTLSEANDPVPNDVLRVSGLVVGVNPATDEVVVSSKSPADTSPGRLFQFEGDLLVNDFGVPGNQFDGFLFGIAARGEDPGRLYAMATDSAAFGGVLGVPRVQVFDDVGELAEPPTVGFGDVALGPDPATEATFSGVVNPEGSPTTWRFEYRPVGAVDWTQAPPTDRDAGDGTEDVDVEASVDDLDPNTDYEVRLVAANSGGSSATDPAQFTTAAAPPVVVSADAIAGATMATLRGLVNPRNSPTPWRMEYRAKGVTEWIVAGQGNAGAGGSPVGVVARAEGLAPRTAYEFRLLAESGAGGDVSPVLGFETDEPLPNRAYELVSPVPNGGVNVSYRFEDKGGASESGDRALFPTFFFPFPGSESAQVMYLASRGENGWSTEAADPPPQGATWSAQASNAIVSRDGSHVLVGTTGSYDADDQNAELGGTVTLSSPGRDLYLRDPDGELTWISRDPRIDPGEPQTDDALVGRAGAPEMSSMSADGSVVVFNSRRKLLDEDPNDSGDSASDSRLYKWSDGDLSLVSVRPNNSAPTGVVLGNAGGFAPNAVSRDGSRVFWRDTAVSGARLFVQIDGEDPLEASATQGGLAGNPGQLNYAGAAADGSRVYFTANRRLTPDSGGSHGGGVGDADLYAFDVDAALAGNPPLRDLTPRLDGGTNPEEDPDIENRARVLGVATVADDGRSVYFVAAGQLDAEPAPDGSEPAPGGANLYRAELNDIEGDVRMRFIATLPSGDENAIWSFTTGTGSTWAFRQAHASPDGSVLAFSSTGSLVAGQPTEALRQIYVYDDTAGTLACASCPGDGAPPVGRVNTTDRLENTSFVRNGQAQIRWVSADGTLYFNTPTQLLAADQNQFDDVYEYHHGELRLISAGTGPSGSAFFDASRDGSTVFFFTRDALVPQDDEPGVRKVYAARVGGGFPGSAPPAPPCLGDGCQGNSPAAPQGDDLGSRSIEGSGDLADNRFAFGRAKKNRRRGKAKLTVKIPGPGELELDRNRKVKPAEKTAHSQGKVRLQVKPTRNAKRKLRRKLRGNLRRRGNAGARARIKVRARVTFAPEGGETRTKAKRLTLVKSRGGNRKRKASKR